MDGATATIICALITTIGTVAVAKVGARSKVENQEIMTRLARLEDRQIQSELITCRTDLLQSIKIDPHNSVAIMETGKRYFLELGGNSYASKPFARWAITEQIDIRALYNTHNDLEFYIENPELTMRN